MHGFLVCLSAGSSCSCEFQGATIPVMADVMEINMIFSCLAGTTCDKLQSRARLMLVDVNYAFFLVILSQDKICFN